MQENWEQEQNNRFFIVEKARKEKELRCLKNHVIEFLSVTDRWCAVW